MYKGVQVVAASWSLLLARDSEAWWGILGVVFAVALMILTLVWHSWRSDSLLNQWAAHNGYRIIRKKDEPRILPSAASERAASFCLI
jgi:hypothetical protein